MKVTDTQLAAALVALGEKPMSEDVGDSGVVFVFYDNLIVLAGEQRWRDMSRCVTTVGDTPVEIMFRVSKAREWMLKQVVHGHHNEGLALPMDVVTTYEFHVAVALVAKGCYLLKLDKRSRMFYFSAVALEELNDYRLPSQWYRHARVYLETLEGMVRRIRNRNLTRQGKQDTITCSQVSAPNPMKGILRHA